MSTIDEKPIQEPEIEEADYELRDLEEDEPDLPKTPATLAREPLLATLLNEVIAKLWPGDPVMADFSSLLIGPITEHFAGRGAKGGDFAAQHLADGKAGVERYLADQSMRAHLLNGLFPVLNIARALQVWGAPQFRAYDDLTRRVFIAGYILHDYLKLEGVEEQLQAAGFSPAQPVGPAQMPVLEAIFQGWCRTLALDQFLGSVSLGSVSEVLSDLIYVASNTQVRWGTLRNLSLLSQLKLSPAQLSLAENLSHLADLLAYPVRTPQDVSLAGVQDSLTSLSGGLARFTYHHLANNRGVLTNFIHNAAIQAMSHEYRRPLLYAPSGVIYLEHKKLAPPCGRNRQ